MNNHGQFVQYCTKSCTISLSNPFFSCTTSCLWSTTFCTILYNLCTMLYKIVQVVQVVQDCVQYCNGLVCRCDFRAQDFRAQQGPSGPTESWDHWQAAASGSKISSHTVVARRWPVIAVKLQIGPAQMLIAGGNGGNLRGGRRDQSELGGRKNLITLKLQGTRGLAALYNCE